MAWIETGGFALPAPIEGSSGVSISTLVDGGRSANGTFIGQVVGADKYKIECQFDFASDEEVRRLFALFDRRQGGSFTRTFRVYDAALGRFATKTMYVGDRTARPLRIHPETFAPALWREVKFSLVEV